MLMRRVKHPALVWLILAILVFAPIFLAVSAALGEEATRNGDSHQGKEVDCDLPVPLRVRNTVGTDRQGLCVWASTQMMAHYENIDELATIFADMQREPGGGWPARVDEKMAKYAPTMPYKQYLGSDLQFIRDGIESGRPVCATYGYGEMYPGTIAHMVLIVAMDDRFTAVLDNNDPEHLWWMSTSEYKRRFAWPTGQGWAWYTLGTPPPPPPRNRPI